MCFPPIRNKQVIQVLAHHHYCCQGFHGPRNKQYSLINVSTLQIIM